MNKTMLSIFFLISLTSVSALCTDSDGGMDIYENGEIHFISPHAPDYDTGMYTYDTCSNGILYERYCSDDGVSIETEETECPDGYKCSIDKCIEDDEDYVSDIESDGDDSSPSSSGGGGGGSACRDSDGGFVYDVKGTVTRTGEDPQTDYCESDPVLIEYACGRQECTTTENECEPPEPTLPAPRIELIYITESIQSTINGEAQSRPIAGITKSLSADITDHVFLFQKEDYKDCERTIAIESGEIATLRITLALAESQDDCTVDVTTNPYSGSGGGGGGLHCGSTTNCELVETTERHTCDYACNDGACTEQQRNQEQTQQRNLEAQRIIRCPVGTDEETEEDATGITIHKCKKALSNGRKAEIKIMPERASERATERLGELEFEVELKEVGTGEQTRAVYQAKARKQGRLLGIFKVNGDVSADIDPETGDIISVKKPWWAFLAAGV